MKLKLIGTMNYQKENIGQKEALDVIRILKISTPSPKKEIKKSINKNSIKNHIDTN